MEHNCILGFDELFEDGIIAGNHGLSKASFVVTFLSGMLLITGCAKTSPLDYNQPDKYKEVLESYLPDGYEIETEWKKDAVNSYASSTTGSTQNRRYKIYQAYYKDVNDRRTPDEADEAVIMDSMYIEAYGGESYRDKAMVDSIKEALEDNVRRLIEKEVKTKYYVYGTQIIHLDFNMTDEEILANKCNINLAQMTWDDVKNLNATIQCEDVYTASTQYTEEEIIEAMEEFKVTIESVGGAKVEYKITKN